MTRGSVPGRVDASSDENPHYKQDLENDSLGQWDIPDGRRVTVVIESSEPYIPARRRALKGPDGRPVLDERGRPKLEPIKKYKIFFVGKRKYWIAGPVSQATIAGMYGPKRRDWVGKKITLYVDDSVTFGRKKTGGIRVVNRAPTEEPTSDPLDRGVDEEAMRAIEEARREFYDEPKEQAGEREPGSDDQ